MKSKIKIENIYFLYIHENIFELFILDYHRDRLIMVAKGKTMINYGAKRTKRFDKLCSVNNLDTTINSFQSRWIFGDSLDEFYARIYEKSVNTPNINEYRDKKWWPSYIKNLIMLPPKVEKICKEAYERINNNNEL